MPGGLDWTSRKLGESGGVGSGIGLAKVESFAIRGAIPCNLENSLGLKSPTAYHDIFSGQKFKLNFLAKKTS